MSDASRKPPKKKSKARQRSKPEITDLPGEQAIRKLFPKKFADRLKRIVDRSDDSEQPTK